jgi:3-deoxy-D-manno-octulosonic-acid transferase
MARPPFDKARLSRFVGRQLARYIDFVRRTSRVVTEPADLHGFAAGHQPFIAAFWHGQFLMIPALHPREIPVRIMVARHTDAETIGEALKTLNLELIRGAGAGTRRRDRGGAYALRAALRALAGGYSVPMTADVPPGPARRAGVGIVTLAKMSGCPIVPFAVATTRYVAFNTWSRMTLNLPFGTLAGIAGEPIHVAANADEEALEAARRAVEDGLNRVTARAYQLAGADPARATPTSQTDPTAPPAMPGFGLKAYRAATRLAAKAAPTILRVREQRGKEEAARRGERLGRASVPRPDGRLVWIHAASVGETNAILPLITALRTARPDARFLLTTGTVTSAKLAAQRLGPHAVHQYVPLDAPAFVARFLDHWKPDLAIFTESEIWPNLVLEGAARGIPLALVNASVSKTSYRRWRRNRGVAQPLFNRFAIVLAQNEKLARRLGELGARNVLAVGNIKIDAPPPPVNESELDRLTAALAGRPHLMAASTHHGEDEIAAAVHRRVAPKLKGFCTIIAPRHPERGASIAERLKAQGFSVSQRSLGALPAPGDDIYIADTIGELGTLYALSPVAFIGGSLVERGGQNPIEAIRHGAAVLTGPHWQNFKDTYRALLRHNGAMEVRSVDEFAVAALTLLRDEEELARIRAGANIALATLSGALQRTVDALLDYWPESEGLRRAS